MKDVHSKSVDSPTKDIVLEKSIFNNVFEKDIQSVFIYKKAERLAKALHLVSPAFSATPSLGERLSLIGMTLVDAALERSVESRAVLSRELLALSSVLAIARTGGLLSAMNSDLIAREAQALLQEVVAYEEPRISFDETPSLADLSKSAQKTDSSDRARVRSHSHGPQNVIKDISVKDTVRERRDALLSVIRTKKRVSIKDLSMVIRDVSEKTIQRELIALIQLGLVVREGERRWSSYSLA